MVHSSPIPHILALCQNPKRVISHPITQIPTEHSHWWALCCRELTTCKWFVSFYRSANQLQGIKSQWTASHGWPEREPQSPAAWPHTQLKKGPGDPERPGFTRETITSCAYTCSFLMSTLLTSWSMFESWAQSTRTATSRKRCLVCCSRHRWPHGARDKPLEADLGPQRLWLGPISFNI